MGVGCVRVRVREGQEEHFEELQPCLFVMGRQLHPTHMLCTLCRLDEGSAGHASHGDAEGEGEEEGEEEAAMAAQQLARLSAEGRCMGVGAAWGRQQERRSPAAATAAGMLLPRRSSGHSALAAAVAGLGLGHGAGTAQQQQPACRREVLLHAVLDATPDLLCKESTVGWLADSLTAQHGQQQGRLRASVQPALQQPATHTPMHVHSMWGDESAGAAADGVSDVLCELSEGLALQAAVAIKALWREARAAREKADGLQRECDAARVALAEALAQRDAARGAAEDVRTLVGALAGQLGLHQKRGSTGGGEEVEVEGGGGSLGAVNCC
jgi:hypothetical protein